ESREGLNRFVNAYFRFENAPLFCQTQHRRANFMQFALRTENRSGNKSIPTFRSLVHWFEKAVPIFTLRNREGEAPCPVPITCIGWPLLQFGVPKAPTRWHCRWRRKSSKTPS